MEIRLNGFEIRFDGMMFVEGRLDESIHPFVTDQSIIRVVTGKAETKVISMLCSYNVIGTEWADSVIITVDDNNEITDIRRCGERSK